MENEKMPQDPIKAVEVAQVLHVVVKKGNGDKDEPVRLVHQLWSLDGVFLSEFEASREPLLFKKLG